MQVRERIRVLLMDRTNDNTVERARLKQILYLYHLSMRDERLTYYERQCQALAAFGTLVSLITDGADSK